MNMYRDAFLKWLYNIALYNDNCMYDNLFNQCSIESHLGSYIVIYLCIITSVFFKKTYLYGCVGS